MIDGRALGKQHTSSTTHRRRCCGAPRASFARPVGPMRPRLEVRRFADAAAACRQTREEEHVVPVAICFSAMPARTSSRAPSVRQRRGVTLPHGSHVARPSTARDSLPTRARDDAVSRDRPRRVRAALRVIRGRSRVRQREAGRFFATPPRSKTFLDPVLLSSIDAAGSLVASRSVPLKDLAAKLRELGRANTVDRAIGEGWSARSAAPYAGARRRTS